MVQRKCWQHSVGDSTFSFSNQIDKVIGRISSGIFLLSRLFSYVGYNAILQVYYGCIYPDFMYCFTVWEFKNSKPLNH